MKYLEDGRVGLPPIPLVSSSAAAVARPRTTATTASDRSIDYRLIIGYRNHFPIH